jgi:hypothetical protein
MRKLYENGIIFEKVFTKMNCFNKLDSGTACTVHVVSFIYITLRLHTVCVLCMYVGIQLPLKLKRKFLYFRENFLSKIAVTFNLNDVDYLGNRARLYNVY